MLCLFFSLITVLQIVSVNGYVSINKNNATLLTEELLRYAHPPTNRPVLAPNNVINVTLSFVLTKIIELNDIQQELTVAGWYTMKWKDELIQWDASAYNVDCINLPEDSIWKPDITLDNNIDEEFNQFLPNSPINVCSDGRATYSAYAIFRSSCHISIKLFPYDNQTCNLRFVSWVYDASQLDLYPFLRTVDQQEQFDENGVWRLVSVDARREFQEYKTFNPFVYTIFSFNLKRYHEFHLLFIFIPYIFCSFLISLTFFIPIESGEKLSYGITAVLGLIVFQQIIAFSLPPVGNESTIVGKYFTAVICFGIISVFVEIVVNNIHMQGNVWKSCMYILNWYKKKVRERSNVQENNQTEETGVGQQVTTSMTEEQTQYLQHICTILDFWFGICSLVVSFIFLLWFCTVVNTD